MSRTTGYIIIAVLAVATLLFGSQYFNQRAQIADFESQSMEVSESNETEAFLKLFVEKVLGADGEVSFDDRLRLETEVRDLGNETILNAWNTFVASETSNDAQNNLRALITITVDSL